MNQMPKELIVAVDGGGSKTDVVALSLEGELVAHLRGEGCSPHFLGLEASVARVDALIGELIGPATVVQADLYLSGLDLPVEVENYRTALAGKSWAAKGLVVENDLFALLRAGSDATDAVVVICGTGINALGRRADGEVARFAALGGISGDWGGGYGLGAQVLWHAARAVDGRGPETALVEAVCTTLDVPDVPTLITQLHFGERGQPELARLAPALFAAADAGDEIALELVHHQADEIVAFVRATAKRLRFERPFEVVLGGGILQAEIPVLQTRLADALAADVPLAKATTVRQAPVVGAGLLALEHAGASASALENARAKLDLL